MPLTPSAPQGRGFHTWPPLAKVLAWAAAVVATALLLMAAAWLFGVDPTEFFYRARSALLVIALGFLMALMLTDRRPTSAYGVIVGEHWVREVLVGFAIGAAFYVAYCLVAVAAGALVFTPGQASAWQWARALTAVVAALLVAAVQQTMFSGYLVSMLRERHGQIVAVLVPSALFAFLGALDSPTEFSWRQFPLCSGMFLTSVLLTLVRLRSGGMPLPVGLLAGCIFVRRLIKKTFLLAAAGGEPLTSWFAPANDPRQGWVFQLLIAAAIAVYWVRLVRLGEAPPVNGSALHPSFKRLVPMTNPFSLAPLDLWLRVLYDARFCVQLSYLPRLCVILLCSAVNTLLTLPERLILPWLMRHRVRDPLFIMGVHRSGTTHLHNMLALDPNLAAPKNYHVLNPHGFMTTGWLITTLLGPFMSSKRPMDSVRMHAFTPQEEEFGICGMCRQSAYWAWPIPRRHAHYDRFILNGDLSAKELRSWQRAYLLFLRKLTFWSRKTPVLKSPYNTGKVGLFREMFPRAKFVHIARHPYAVYPSNMHLAQEALVMYQLHDPHPNDNYRTRFLGHYRAQEDAFYRQSAELPADQLAELRFEDLERDPLGEIRRIYAQLRLDLTPTFEKRLQRYLESTAEYKKNTFRPLAEDVRGAIDQTMMPYMRHWGYVGGTAPQVLPQRKAA